MVIIDYGLGNIGSITNALAKLGIKAQLSSKSQDIFKADAIIFPGDGAAEQAMANLKKRNLINSIKEIILSGKPFLGICLGMQILLSFSEEGNVECLDVIKGKVIRFKSDLKIPQIGWNQVQRVQNTALKINNLFKDIPDRSYFYFINGYYCLTDEKEIVVAETNYGQIFCSVFMKKNVIGVQFHPEKSGVAGLNFLKNFTDFAYANNSGN